MLKFSWGLLPAATAITAVATITTTVATALAATTAAVTATATTAAAATKATATTTTTAAAESRTLFTRTRFIDRQEATAEVLAVKSVDGVSHGLCGIHGDKGKAAWTAAIAIHRQVDIGDNAVSGKEIAQVVLSGAKGEIPHIHLRVHIYLSYRSSLA